MARKLKVYHWLDFARYAKHDESPWSKQIDCIVAAHSKAEVTRLAGYKYPSQMFNLGETGNAQDIEQAMSEPLAIFWTWTSERVNMTYKKWEDR